MTSRPRTVLTWIIGTLLALPVLYILSFGPVLRLYFELESEPNLESFNKIYQPLGWAAERSESFDRFVEWYSKLWMFGEF